MPLGGALTIAGAATGLAGGIGGMFASAKSNKELKKIMKEQPTAAGAQQRLGLAQQLFNARMPGAAAAERNIATNAAGTMANASRAASSGAQLLAMGGASQGQVGEAYNQLAQQEAANRQQQYQNLAEAQQATDEDRYRMFQNKVQLQGAMAANRSNMWSSIGNLGGQIAQAGSQFTPQSAEAIKAKADAKAAQIKAKADAAAAKAAAEAAAVQASQTGY